MSDKNNLTGEVKEILLAQLLENSKKFRLKSIAERYGIKLPDKYTKQQMIDVVLPAIEVHFGTKLKQYSGDDLSIAMECFTEHEITEQSANRIMASLPFSDGAVFLINKKNSYYAAVPHELAGKIMSSCVSNCFDKGKDELDICANACAAIYGRFSAKMLADTANAAYSLHITEQQAEQYLASSDSPAFTFAEGAAQSTSVISTEILPEASEADYYIPTRREIESYATYGADTGDYYYRHPGRVLDGCFPESHETAA